MADAHKLTVYGKGGDIWGACSCDWAWLGTYEFPKGKRAKLKVAHAEHVERMLAIAGGA